MGLLWGKPYLNKRGTSGPIQKITPAKKTKAFYIKLANNCGDFLFLTN